MHIVFDFDGTLFDTHALWQAWLDQLEQLGVNRDEADETGEELFKIGFTLRDHGEMVGLNGDELDQLVSDFEEYTRQESERLIYEDVSECLDAWGSDHSFSILTFGHPEYQNFKIEAVGLNDLVSDIRIARPERVKSMQLAEMLAESDEPMMFIDDNPKELQSVHDQGLDIELVRMCREGSRHCNESHEHDGNGWRNIHSLEELFTQ